MCEQKWENVLWKTWDVGEMVYAWSSLSHLCFGFGFVLGLVVSFLLFCSL